jgi:hypothetical protein
MLIQAWIYRKWVNASVVAKRHPLIVPRRIQVSDLREGGT